MEAEKADKSAHIYGVTDDTSALANEEQPNCNVST